jgi:hypothetical protein
LHIKQRLADLHRQRIVLGIGWCIGGDARRVLCSSVGDQDKIS